MRLSELLEKLQFVKNVPLDITLTTMVYATILVIQKMDLVLWTISMSRSPNPRVSGVLLAQNIARHVLMTILLMTSFVILAIIQQIILSLSEDV